ncbi:hypothetical protein DSO57_1031338 [Entomophthora muscae]|uniref:Uncharacterized protein n=1 Tax=Entomophthora muscae TaxID=34485 RepID=A0ACC2UL97_9FUNG|nr:hypothetical protein DSO57_1031338 [Entomophthora muscae]
MLKVANKEEPEFYHIVKGQKVLKKVTKYYTQVSMPTVTQPDTTTQYTPKAVKPIPNTKRFIFIKLMKCVRKLRTMVFYHQPDEILSLLSLGKYRESVTLA